MFKSSTPKKTILIIGGSFGGLTAIQYLNSSFNVILVDRKQFFEYTPNYPFTLFDPNYIDGMTVSLQDFAKTHKCQFIQGTLVQLLKDKALIKQSNEEILDVLFDYCIISTGSQYASSIKPENEIKTIQQRKEQIIQQIQNLQNYKKVLVVGGGPVGVEIAGVLSDHYKNLKVHLWNRSQELLYSFPEKSRILADQILKNQGVLIEYNKEVNQLPLTEFDQVFDCRGNIYAPSFMIGEFQQCKSYFEILIQNKIKINKQNQQDVDSQGRILVDEYCRLTNHKNIFCIGDACLTPNNESKMCYNAAIQGQFTGQNIISLEKNSKSLKKLEGTANVFLITVNKQNAIQCFGNRVSQTSTSNKHSLQNKAIKSLQGSCFYSFVSSFSRRMIILISGCQKKKQPQSVNKQS
ncbi:hypothetical protein ABPG74_004258 [Tetrahymena malaccensis]